MSSNDNKSKKWKPTNIAVCSYRSSGFAPFWRILRFLAIFKCLLMKCFVFFLCFLLFSLLSLSNPKLFRAALFAFSPAPPDALSRHSQSRLQSYRLAIEQSHSAIYLTLSLSTCLSLARSPLSLSCLPFRLSRSKQMTIESLKKL